MDVILIFMILLSMISLNVNADAKKGEKVMVRDGFNTLSTYLPIEIPICINSKNDEFSRPTLVISH